MSALAMIARCAARQRGPTPLRRCNDATAIWPAIVPHPERASGSLAISIKHDTLVARPRL